jgi:hypothetical protein
LVTYQTSRDAQHLSKPVESAEEALKSQRESDDSRTTVKKSIEDKDTRATLRPELDPRMPRGVRASHPGPDPNDPAVNRRVHCDPASAVNCPGLAILTKEMAEFVQPAVNRMLPENRVDRYQKEIDYEGVAFVLEGKAKELYVINPGGDQRMAYKGFKPSPEEPAEVSALAREGVFLRAPGSFQMPIDWYRSLIKWGDTCTEAAVRRAAWYPESYVGLLSSGRALALRVIALPPEADLTWLNGTRLADGCKPFDLVAKEMLERGHTGVSEGLKAAFFHSVNVKKSYWVGTDEKYHWSDPTPEKKSRKAPVEESPQPQPVVSKRDEDCKTGLMLLHASEPSGLATDAQDKSAGRGRRRIWEEEGKRVGRQTHQQSWKSKEKGQPSSPGSSLATPIKLEGGVKDRGKWYNPTHLDKRSYQPVFFQPYLFGSFHEALWYCYEEVVLASLFTRKTQGRTPYTRIFDRLAMAARSNQRGRTSDLARLNGVVRQLACGMIVGAGDVLRENPVGQTVVPHNGVLTMLTLYVIWWHENKHHPPPLGDQFDFSGLAQAVKRRTRPPEPPEPPAPWPQPPWRSGNVERMYPNSEVWDGDKGSTANDLWRVPRRCPQAQGKKQPLLPKPGIKWAMPQVQRPCPRLATGTNITQVQMNVGHSSQSVMLQPEAGSGRRQQQWGAGNGAFGPKANRLVPGAAAVPVAETEAEQGGLSNCVEDLQGEDWDEVMAMLEHNQEPAWGSKAVGDNPENPLIFMPAQGWGGHRSPPPDPPCSPPSMRREQTEAADMEKAIIQSETEQRLEEARRQYHRQQRQLIWVTAIRRSALEEDERKRRVAAKEEATLKEAMQASYESEKLERKLAAVSLWQEGLVRAEQQRTEKQRQRTPPDRQQQASASSQRSADAAVVRQSAAEEEERRLRVATKEDADMARAIQASHDSEQRERGWETIRRQADSRPDQQEQQYVEVQRLRSSSSQPGPSGSHPQRSADAAAVAAEIRCDDLRAAIRKRGGGTARRCRRRVRGVYTFGKRG